MEKEKLGFKSVASYALARSTGMQFIGSAVATYILVFMTDTFGVPAGAVGMITFIATIWDAVNDPMMGVLADKTKSKWGRYRPYLLFAPIPLAIVSVLLFAAPDLSTNGKIVYAATLYICYGMLTTVMQIPFGALLPAMTVDGKESAKVVQAYTFLASFVILIATSFTTTFVDIAGKGDASKGYMIVIGIAGVLMVITSWIAFKNCEEKYVDYETIVPLKEVGRVLIKRKEVFPIMLAWCMGFMAFQIMMSSSIYYILYCLKNPALITPYMLALNIGGMLGIVFVIPLFMKLFKGSARTGFMISQGITVVLYLIGFFIGYEKTGLILAISGVAAVFSTMTNAYIPMISVEVTNYIDYKSGKQLNGIIASVTGFSNKCGAAIANGVIGLLLGATGYVANDIAGQGTKAMTAISVARWIVPAVAGFIVILCLVPYPVDQIKDDIQEYHQNRKTKKEESLC